MTLETLVENLGKVEEAEFLREAFGKTSYNHKLWQRTEEILYELSGETQRANLIENNVPPHVVSKHIGTINAIRKEEAFEYAGNNLEKSLYELNSNQIKKMLFSTMPKLKEIKGKEYKKIAKLHRESIELDVVARGYADKDDSNKEVYFGLMRAKVIEDLKERFKNDKLIETFIFQTHASQSFVENHYATLVQRKAEELIGNFVKGKKLDKKDMAKYIAMNIDKADDREKESFYHGLYKVATSKNENGLRMAA
jgi:hypothetical protein